MFITVKNGTITGTAIEAPLFEEGTKTYKVTEHLPPGASVEITGTTIVATILETTEEKKRKLKKTLSDLIAEKQALESLGEPTTDIDQKITEIKSLYNQPQTSTKITALATEITKETFMASLERKREQEEEEKAKLMQEQKKQMRPPMIVEKAGS